VSGGADNNVCITDIGTGRILQTLRGHTGQVLCLSFDTERIISASRDSTLRYWKWGDKRYQPADKYHMMAPTDSLPLIAKTYELELETLMKWNGLRDVKDSYPGMRLIVRKANPDQLTKAELLEFEKQRKRLKGIEQTDKKIRQLQMESGSSSLSLQQHSRVHKIATDIDPYSIGNRMFHQQKINSELFPEKTDLFVDHQSLGSRIRANTGKRREFGGPVVKILTTKANENEWGAISDELAMSILESFIEFQAYELVTEEKKKLRDGLSVLGRMNMTRQQKAMNTKLLMGVGSKANRKKGKREKIEKAMALWSDPIGEEGEGEGGEGGKGGEGGGDEEKEEKRRKRREQREKDKRERRERKEKERKEREGKGTEGGGGAGGEGSHPSAPSSVNENEHSEEERGSASEDEDEEEEEERDRIFNRKKHRKDKDQSSGPQPSDIHLGDDHSSEAGEGEGEGGDYGLVLNKRKGSSSSNVSKGSQESSGGTGTGGGDDEATTAAKAKAARKALRGEGDEKEGDEEEERKSQSSKGGAPPSSLTSSRRGSNQSETAASARALTPTGANGSRLRLSQQQRQQQQQQERLRRSSASSTGSGQGQRQPSSSSASASVSSSLQGSSIQVDDEDADLLSLLKKDNGAGRRGGGQQGQMDDDDCDY
jgi:LysM repeat protein